MRRPLIIVGAGPGGLAAATTAAAAGLSPTVIDENPQIGGQIYRETTVPCSNPSNGHDATRGAELKRRFHHYRDRITLLNRTVVWGLIPPRSVLIVREGKSEVIEAEHLILAPGAYEFVPPFPGWTLPGVMTPGGAQAMVKSMGVLPGRRVLIAGTGPFLLVVALSLHAAGMEVVGIVEAVRAREILPVMRNLLNDIGLLKQGWRYLRDVNRAGIPIHRGHVIVEARGKDGLREAVIAPCDDQWRPRRDRSFSLPVDTLCVGYGFVPRTQLAELAGCRLRRDPSTQSWVPVVSRDFETSVRSVWTVGDGGGVAGAVSAELEGEIAGWAVASRLGTIDEEMTRKRLAEIHSQLERLERFRLGLDQLCSPRAGLVELAEADTIVCRCEELTRSDIDSGISFGGRNSRTLKPMTRLGMGPCQGATCWPAMCRYIAARTGQSAEAVGHSSVRIPVRPVTLGQIASLPYDERETETVTHET